MWDFAECPRDLCFKLLRKVIKATGYDEDVKYVIRHCEEDPVFIQARMNGKILFKNKDGELNLADFWLQLRREEPAGKIDGGIFLDCCLYSQTPITPDGRPFITLALNEDFTDKMDYTSVYYQLKCDLELHSEAFED